MATYGRSASTPRPRSPRAAAPSSTRRWAIPPRAWRCARVSGTPPSTSSTSSAARPRPSCGCPRARARQIRRASRTPPRPSPQRLAARFAPLDEVRPGRHLILRTDRPLEDGVLELTTWVTGHGGDRARGQRDRSARRGHRARSRHRPRRCAAPRRAHRRDVARLALAALPRSRFESGPRRRAVARPRPRRTRARRRPGASRGPRLVRPGGPRPRRGRVRGRRRVAGPRHRDRAARAPRRAAPRRRASRRFTAIVLPATTG